LIIWLGSCVDQQCLSTFCESSGRL